MLEVVGLAAGYLGEPVIYDVDVEVRTGEAVAIVGSNGAGKTTLFRAIAGLLPRMAGRVVLDGKDLTRSPAHRISRTGIAYVPAERHLFSAMTVLLSLGAREPRSDDLDRDVIAADFDLSDRRKRLFPFCLKHLFTHDEGSFNRRLRVILDRIMLDVGVQDLERRRGFGSGPPRFSLAAEGRQL